LTALALLIAESDPKEKDVLIKIIINLLPDINLNETIKQWQEKGTKTELKNLIGEMLTRRVAHRWLELFYHNKPVNRYNEKEISETEMDEQETPANTPDSGTTGGETGLSIPETQGAAATGT